MSLPADLLYLSLLIVGIVGFRRRRGWPFAVAAIVAGVALLRDLVQLPEVSWRIGILDIVLAGLVAVLVADVKGLPLSIARRVGLGFRSREWEFDDQLHRYKEALDRILMSYPHSAAWPEYVSWKLDALRRVSPTLRRMTAMRAPDVEWDRLRDDYVALYEGIFANIAHDEPADNVHILRVGQEIKERADRLRVEYRASAHALIAGRKPRL